MSEKNKLFLFNLLKISGNESCADCGERGIAPDWASENIGIFLCIKCSGLHRNIGKHISFIRSLRLDHWTDEECEFMSSMGNLKANTIWTKYVPVCWKRPVPTDHTLDFYVEEWIRAKYERKEFVDEGDDKRPYCTGQKDGLLLKKERHSNRWNQRYFKLTAESCSLSYYNKITDVKPIREMNLKYVNVMLCSFKKTDKFFSMQISYPEENEKGKKAKTRTRYIYVHAETGRDIVDWYLAIRAARFKNLGLSKSDEKANEMLSFDNIKEGWLKKSGPKDSDRYQQRWITVVKNKFSYFEDRLDSTAKHEVQLENNLELYAVSEGVDGKHPDEPNPFMVQTPERVYNFSAETREEMEEWMQAFRDAIRFDSKHVLNTPL